MCFNSFGESEGWDEFTASGLVLVPLWLSTTECSHWSTVIETSTTTMQHFLASSQNCAITTISSGAFHCLSKMLYFSATLPQPPSLLPGSGQPLICLLFVLLSLFWSFHIKGVTAHVGLCSWLLSVCMFSMLPCVLVSCSLMTNIPLCDYIYSVDSLVS